MDCFHFHRGLFAGLTASLATHRLGRSEGGMPIQPAGQDDAARQAPCLARQIGEDHLRYVLGQMTVPTHHPSRGRIHQIDMTTDQLAESRFGSFARVSPQELFVFSHFYCLILEPARSRNPTAKMRKKIGRNTNRAPSGVYCVARTSPLVRIAAKRLAASLVGLLECGLHERESSTR